MGLTLLMPYTRAKDVQKKKLRWGKALFFHGFAAQHFNADMEKLSWHSQDGQDRLLIDILGNKTNGFFVDLAANHATSLSYTYSLEKFFNWTGLCIEANPVYAWGLSGRKCTAIFAAVGNNTGINAPFVFNGVFGGLRAHLPNGWLPKRNQINEHLLPTITLAQILQTFRAPSRIDYLSLDTEGAEEVIMWDFPFDKYTFLTISVERPSAALCAS